MTAERARWAGRIGRALDVLLPVYAAIVFVIVWGYVAVTFLTDSTLAADTWAWLSGLDTIAAVVVWLAILPLGVFLWAWQADLQPLFMGVVMLGLVAWTIAAVSGSLRSARRLRAGGQA